MEHRTLAEIFRTAAITGAERAIRQDGSLKAQLSISEASRRYGRSQIERWLQEGLIAFTVPPEGNSLKKVVDRQRLEAVSAASNRCTYLPVADREVL
jgi:hypothetical protein